MVKNKQNNRIAAFTIVELLVVIVVIGILAAITIVSYSGVQKKAVIASLQSDLSSDAKKMKMYNVEYGHYPSTFKGNNCPLTPEEDDRYCLKYSSDTTITYTGGGQAFKIKATKSGITYLINEGSAPYPASAPIIGSNTAVGVKTSIVNFGATVSSDEGDAITDAGICWGTTADPTTNCVSNYATAGALVSLGSAAATAAPRDVAISPDGKSVYIAVITANKVYEYSRSTTTGLLTLIGTIASGTSPYGVAVSPDGKNVYTATVGDCYVHSFTRDTSTGLLVALGGATGGSIMPTSLAVSPDGGSVYASDTYAGKVVAFSRSAVNGEITFKSLSAAVGTTALNGTAVSPDSAYVYAGFTSSKNIAIFSRDPATSLITFLNSVTVPAGVQDIVISNDGTSLYAIASGSIYSYSRNISDGSLTYLATVASCGGSIAGAISPDGTSVYSTGSASVCKHDRNATTKLLSASTSVAAGSNSFGVVVSPDNMSVYVADNGTNAVPSFNRNSGMVVVGTPFMQTRAALTSGATIHYRAYATNSIGTTYSTDSTVVVP